jgi:hypothetical protein
MEGARNGATCTYSKRKRSSSSQGSAFIPGDWRSWPGLSTPGLLGSDEELLLDEMMDIQEELRRHWEQLSPR